MGNTGVETVVEPVALEVDFVAGRNAVVERIIAEVVAVQLARQVRVPDVVDLGNPREHPGGRRVDVARDSRRLDSRNRNTIDKPTKSLSNHPGRCITAIITTTIMLEGTVRYRTYISYNVSYTIIIHLEKRFDDTGLEIVGLRNRAGSLIIRR